jgi:cytochrome c-type biogenesis protein CcmF
VFIKPMILWLWIGGGIMALGTLLAAFPGSRRRIAVDPVSAPIATGGPDSTTTVPAEDQDSAAWDADAAPPSQDEDTETGVPV